MNPTEGRLLEHLAVLYDPGTVERVWKAMQEKLTPLTESWRQEMVREIKDMLIKSAQVITNSTERRVNDTLSTFR